MSGSAEATAALRDAVTVALAGVSRAVTIARDAQPPFRAADDLVDLMQATVPLILSLEALSEVAAAAEKQARAALAQTMTATGATTVRTPAHTVSTKEAARTVVVTDRALIPAQYMRPREPEPDRAALGAALRQGQAIPGVALSNGGAATLQIRPRERTDA